MATIPPRAQRGEADGALPLVSLAALSLAVVPVLLHAALFVVGGTMSAATAALGIVLGLVLPFAVTQHRRQALVALGAVALVVISGFLVQGGSWDNQHDTLVYHEPAAYAIADGMNPLTDDTGIMWVDHYPKAAWVFSAAAYMLTGTIEAGKVLTLLVALACFGVAVPLFRRIATGWPGARTRPWMPWVVATLVAWSPVAIVQWDTHYVDGLFAGLGTMLVLLAVARETWGSLPGASARVQSTIVILAATMLANLKFTGLVFVALLGAVCALRALRLHRNGMHGVRREIALLAAAVALPVLLVGVDPYVTNTLRDGNPFYPVFGADLSDVADAPDVGQRPTAYRGVPAPVAFLYSLADTTRAGSQDEMPESYTPKNPLSVSRAEIAALTLPDARTGGFGPLFFLALLLAVSVAGATVAEVARARTRTPAMREQLVLANGAGLVLVLTVVMGEAWWARLAPVFFLAPVLVTSVGLSGSRITRALCIALLAVLVANSGLALTAQALDYRNRAATRSATLEELGDAESIEIRFPDAWAEEHQSAAYARRLSDLGYAVEVVRYGEGDTDAWKQLPGQPAEYRAVR